MIELLKGVLIEANCLYFIDKVGYIKPTKTNGVPKDYPYLMKVESGREYKLWFSSTKEMNLRYAVLKDYLSTGGEDEIIAG